jgi:2-oxoglutarate dehydrogenase E2 component (dihydrolipoamide succinyltransferase)
VPSPVSGVLGKRLYNEGDVVPVGKAVALVTVEGAEDGNSKPSAAPSATASAPSANGKAVEKEPAMADSASELPGQTSRHLSAASGGRFYSPLVLNIARSEGIEMQELERLAGTGKEGRVTKKDILAYLENRQSAPAGQVSDQPSVLKQEGRPQQQYSAPDVTLFPGDEIVEMDRMRKLIADHMVMSKHVSPHVTSFVEVDVTNIVKWRDKNKSAFEKREGEKITFTPIFIEAVVKAIKDYPGVNVSISGDKIIKRKSINIGMAAALPSGNLIVPVIKNADTKNLIGLTKEVNSLANRARTNQLKPDEIQGGTFTMTNVGTFGNVMGTPIINQPQVAILAVGAIRKKPAVLETQYGDIIAIRHMMFLSLSYDHRVVDGMLGGSFLRRIADYMEEFEENRAW